MSLMQTSVGRLICYVHCPESLIEAAGEELLFAPRTKPPPPIISLCMAV